MKRTILKSKIHNAVVTDAKLEYEGSISIDKTLLTSADILPYEKVHVLNLNNGSRVETYAIEAPAHSGTICMNGAAARLACPGDRIIILSYVLVDEKQARAYKPTLLHLDEANKINKKL
ncbi:MAG: aspartate 1-decarboxylase [Candidatus Omnitrophica bacterium]|nr:aspartate 1-decarboxylase [Candidatus Omnitrophota bacterium]